MGVSDYVRSMLAYTVWANDKVLSAASALDAQQFERIRDPFVHAVSTQRWWHAKWVGDDAAFRMTVAEHLDSAGDAENAAKWAQGAPIHHPRTYGEVRAVFRASHDALRSLGESLTDARCAESEQWWKTWGVENELPLADTIFQVVEHGVQHRSEVAVMLTETGHSPGELDYLNFRIPEFADD
jgi:uncharacterized damage-inducible protein DinB